MRNYMEGFRDPHTWEDCPGPYPPFNTHTHRLALCPIALPVALPTTLSIKNGSVHRGMDGTLQHHHPVFKILKHCMNIPHMPEGLCVRR